MRPIILNIYGLSNRMASSILSTNSAEEKDSLIFYISAGLRSPLDLSGIMKYD